jgi:hypothetical protein
VEAALPEKYIARTGERAYVELVETEGKDKRSFKADVTVLEPTGEAGEESSPGIALAEPAAELDEVSLRAFIAEDYKEKFVEIFAPEDEGLRLVTCIEVLSPSNKRQDSAGWKQYERKRQGLLLGEANLVEIDLLRGGTRMPMLDPWPLSPYTLLVCRTLRAPTCRVTKAYSIRPLPMLRIPLSSPDSDLQVPLQPIVDEIYRRARYHRSIDYRKPHASLLAPEELAWLQEQLKTQSAAQGSAEATTPAP